MLDPKTCVRVLNKGAQDPYTEQEVEQIAAFLWNLAQINCAIFLDDQKTTPHEASDSGNPGEL
ncbi:hypothetical protein GCM10023184_28580 [Flaviaesturariibacter amylovorans]|uniref:Uncharacterized protein n=1 Tax=Flaviaesturariibacter amylovorans TaxID=1084520 RepID=A0ABP8H5F6_9BACT